MKPAKSAVVVNARTGEGRRPWMKQRPDETPAEHSYRLNHSCYRCGRFEADLDKLAEHEDHEC